MKSDSDVMKIPGSSVHCPVCGRLRRVVARARQTDSAEWGSFETEVVTIRCVRDGAFDIKRVVTP